MTFRDEDRRAVDFVMDRQSYAANLSSATTDGLIRERVGYVEAVVSVLKNMEVDEPRRELVTDTLAYVADNARTRMVEPLQFGQQPVA